MAVSSATAKSPNLNHRQYFQIYGISYCVLTCSTFHRGSTLVVIQAILLHNRIIMYVIMVDHINCIHT